MRGLNRQEVIVLGLIAVGLVGLLVFATHRSASSKEQMLIHSIKHSLSSAREDLRAEVQDGFFPGHETAKRILESRDWSWSEEFYYTARPLREDEIGALLVMKLGSRYFEVPTQGEVVCHYDDEFSVDAMKRLFAVPEKP